MNRDIKFRGVSVVSNEFVYGSLISLGDGYLIAKSNDIVGTTNSDDVFLSYSKDEIDVVFPDTIGQFTGLHDKNGKEIYEGDILAADINGVRKRLIGWVEGGVRGYCYDVVYINHPAGEKRWSLYGTVVNDFPNRIEVVGNIYDNKELLEE